MGGEIQVKSQHGQGSSFWFEAWFPITAQDVKAAKARLVEKTVIGYTGPRKKILVVDDKAYNRLVLINLVQPLGFEVAEADNAKLYELEKRMHQIEEERATGLAELNASKDKFFSIVAHDLKGPFMPLLGNLDLLLQLLDVYSQAEIRTGLLSAFNSAKNIFSLLENLLQWARLEQGRMECQPVKIDFRQLVDQNIKLLAANAANKDIILANKVPAGVFVQADENMLYTVVRNLTNNSIKFTPIGGQITISIKPVQNEAAHENPLAEVTVMDTGVGMIPENVAKLFKLEVHHSTTGTAKEQGSGLGLLICKEMVEKNGGQIWVESELGRGTAVKFTVPLDESTSIISMETIPNSPIKTSSAPALVLPPAENIQFLSEAAKMGDIMSINEQIKKIEQLGEQYKPIVKKLRELADNFDDEGIMKLISH